MYRNSTSSDKPLLTEWAMFVNFVMISGMADDQRARSLFFEIIFQVSAPSLSNRFDINIWFLEGKNKLYIAVNMQGEKKILSRYKIQEFSYLWWEHPLYNETWSASFTKSSLLTVGAAPLRNFDRSWVLSRQYPKTTTSENVSIPSSPSDSLQELPESKLS